MGSFGIVAILLVRLAMLSWGVRSSLTATSDLVMTQAAGTTEHGDAASNASRSRPEPAVWEQRGACTLEDRNAMSPYSESYY
mmetsp:Transcript_12964/g.14668  ORF Transcript_12964/g.14668 Transcript_12964/m.14668 type:complete len:82 (+) Transcript_12964:82-327(+)